MDAWGDLRTEEAIAILESLKTAIASRALNLTLTSFSNSWTCATKPMAIACRNSYVRVGISSIPFTASTSSGGTSPNRSVLALYF